MVRGSYGKTMGVGTSFKGIYFLLALLLMIPSTADAARKHKKRKGKAKRPAAEAPAKTPAEPPADETPTPPEAEEAAATSTTDNTTDAAAASEAPAEAQPEASPAAASEPTTEVAGTEAAAPMNAGVAAAPTDEAPMEPQPPPPTPTAAPPPGESEPLRLRVGVNGGIMVFFPGPSYGVNVSARAGVRLNDLLAVYADVGSGFGLGGGGSASNSSVSVSVNAASYWRVGAMAEVSFGPLFISAGPALFKGAWAGITQAGGTSGASQAAFAAAGYFPAGLARVGLSFGDTSGFTLAVEGMAVIGKMTEVNQSAGTSGASQSAKVGKTTLGYSPTLMLGWDMN